MIDICNFLYPVCRKLSIGIFRNSSRI